MSYIKKRITILIVAILSIVLGFSIILVQLQENITFFFTPSEIKSDLTYNKVIRIGGLIVENSIKQYDNLEYVFTITDNKKNITISYKGILPKLFREKQGIVARGMLQENGIFKANELLTKHDENYMPRELSNLQK